MAHPAVSGLLLAVLAGALGPSARAQGPSEPGVPPVERLRQLTPEQRRRALSHLTPERRRVLEHRLERYNQLPLEERSRLVEQYKRFQRLSPNRQQEMRSAFRNYLDLSQERQQAVRPEIRRLLLMPAADRSARLKSRDFGRHYSPRERELIETLSRPTRPME